MNLTDELRDQLRTLIEAYAKETGVRVINIEVQWPSFVPADAPQTDGLHIVAEV